ncbi:hypothetical protein [Nostoc sp. T09]|uniref:hypothetical protein n=1 Tax=Nostoc sp. T09 TaxID=1932621 RepID=UPI000A3C7562
MAKLILPLELTAEIEPHLPADKQFVRVDSDGNFDGDASDAEVYLNGFKLKPTTLHNVLATAPRIGWQQTPDESALTKALTEGWIGGAGLDTVSIEPLPPEQVAEALVDYYDAGVTTLLIRGFDPLQDAIDYGREVIPLVRAEVAKRERQAVAVGR